MSRPQLNRNARLLLLQTVIHRHELKEQTMFVNSQPFTQLLRLLMANREFADVLFGHTTSQVPLHVNITRDCCSIYKFCEAANKTFQVDGTSHQIAVILASASHVQHLWLEISGYGAAFFRRLLPVLRVVRAKKTFKSIVLMCDGTCSLVLGATMDFIPDCITRCYGEDTIAPYLLKRQTIIDNLAYSTAIMSKFPFFRLLEVKAKQIELMQSYDFNLWLMTDCEPWKPNDVLEKLIVDADIVCFDYNGRVEHWDEDNLENYEKAMRSIRRINDKIVLGLKHTVDCGDFSEMDSTEAINLAKRAFVNARKIVDLADRIGLPLRDIDLRLENYPWTEATSEAVRLIGLREIPRKEWPAKQFDTFFAVQAKHSNTIISLWTT
ncbi:hypothetical protein M3Y94_00023000 [Aphelenchoides besseyi]|nr:hypothetical protein M3Y94_00023000 [Aphelenchoides besseyi]KAI6217077.1 hypothetical protein M3Y95_01243300 [Aphelenchoides besseyi]